MYNYDLYKNFVSKPTGVFKVHNGIKSVADIVNHQLSTYGERPAIRVDRGSTYETVSFNAYRRYIVKLIQFFKSVNAEQKVVATLCKNRLEWDMTAMATFYTANILFPLDTKFNPIEFEHLINLSKPDYILVSYAQLPRVREVKKKYDLTTTILVADLTDVFEDTSIAPIPLEAMELSIKDICDQMSDSDIAIKESPLLTIGETILGHYATSGTISLPKIVRISHANIVSEVNSAIDVLNLRPNEDILNLGPYTHIATLVEFLVSKTRGFTVTYFTREPDDDDVLEDEIHKLTKIGVRIKALMAVPKFWIYLVKEVLEEMKNKPVMKKLYEYLISIEKNETLHDIGTIEKAKLTAVRILLRNKMGGYFSYGISSSMKLDGALVLILGKLGITCIDIYGATECTGIISRNKLNDIFPGSCGKIINELEYEIANTRSVPKINQKVGLLLVKGASVAPYYITKENGITPITSDENGFYSTGDLCWVDENRQVFLIGREKELMEWEDGTLIDPQYLSNLLVRSIFIKDAMVTRKESSDKFLSLFVFPDYKRLNKDPEYQKETFTGISGEAALKRRCVDAIKYAESIAKITPKINKERIYLLPKKLERTPTHKIKFVSELKRMNDAKLI